MPDETKVETAVQDAQTPAETPTPAPSSPATPAGVAAPATPATKTYSDADVKAAEDKARREAQAAKDREVARVHQFYQQKLQSTVGKTRKALAQAGVEDPEAVERTMVDEMELDEYRAWKQQAAAQNATFEYGTGILHDIAARYEVELDDKDPALWAPTQSWEEFTDRARKVAQEKVKAKREAEKAAEEKARRDATDKRITSGALETLDVTPAGASTTDDMDKFKPSDSGKLWEMANRQARQSRQGRR